MFSQNKKILSQNSSETTPTVGLIAFCLAFVLGCGGPNTPQARQPQAEKSPPAVESRNDANPSCKREGPQWLPTLQGRINDHADVLNLEQEQDLEMLVSSHEQGTGEQFAVLILKCLPSGQSIEGFSLRTSNYWALGQAGKHNGVLITVAVEDQRARIELGRGLEKTLQIVSEQAMQDFVPKAREGDYFNAIHDAITKLIQEPRTDL